MSYIVRYETGSGLSLDDLKVRETIRAVVVFEADGLVAERTYARYNDRGAKQVVAMQAGKIRKRYEDYYRRTGKRWEVERAEERKRKAAATQARADFLKRLREHADEVVYGLTTTGQLSLLAELAPAPKP